jgi:hypothetical protein
LEKKCHLNQISDLPKAHPHTPTLIIGSAPGIKILKKKYFQGVKIGIGDVPWRAKELGPFKYWITANSVYPLPWLTRDMRDILRSNSHLILNSVSNTGDKDQWLKRKSLLAKMTIASGVTFYDSRHFETKLCDPIRGCCLFFKDLVGGNTIQEILNLKIGKSGPSYSLGSTVALHGLALALILQYNPIYILGVELPKTFGEYKAHKNFKIPREKIWTLGKRYIKYLLPRYKNSTNIDFANNYEQIIEDFQSIIDIAGVLGIRIISLSKTSPLNNLRGVEVGDLINCEHFR